MVCDVLVFNTATVDYRCRQCAFTERQVSPGGLAMRKSQDMPEYSQAQYQRWIDSGCASAGGSGNVAPLLSRAGFRVAAGVNLGKGDHDGLDAQGRFFYDTMTQNGVDMSQTIVHPTLPTGTAFVFEGGKQERGGIAYFPNANNDIDFEQYKRAVKRLNPALVFYMYSGLSDKGDANGGRDLAQFMEWCRKRGCITIADSHTLAGNPRNAIGCQAEVARYRLLAPLLPALDIFFSSCDEARMIENSLGSKRRNLNCSEDRYGVAFLNTAAERFWQQDDRPKLFGVTVSDGAFMIYRNAEGAMTRPTKVASRFMCGRVVDLVGAGDSFRAGVMAYLSKNSEAFNSAEIDAEQAVQMGNLFASLYIKSPLEHRYDTIGGYEAMLAVIKSGWVFDDFAKLAAAVLDKQAWPKVMS